MKDIRFTFFGTPDIAVFILEELENTGFIPELIVTNPDRPQGRKMVLTPPPVKVWAEDHGVKTLQPESLDDSETENQLKGCGSNLYVVAAYGGIIPRAVLDLPEYGVLNVHPSLLPKYRGASPIRSAILADDRETGVTIMKMDEKMDHGPIVAQNKIDIAPENWPPRGLELDERLARLGGSLLATIMPEWIKGNISEIPQHHDLATFCKKITKADGEINLADDPYQNLLKIRAYDGWPGTYFFHKKEGTPTSEEKRVKIVDAELSSDGSLQILRVIPEGKSEMDFETFNSNG